MSNQSRHRPPTNPPLVVKCFICRYKGRVKLDRTSKGAHRDEFFWSVTSKRSLLRVTIKKGRQKIEGKLIGRLLGLIQACAGTVSNFVVLSLGNDDWFPFCPLSDVTSGCITCSSYTLWLNVRSLAD